MLKRVQHDEQVMESVAGFGKAHQFALDLVP